MPKILDDTVKQIMKKPGVTKSQAFAMGTAALQKAGELKPGTNKATPLGAKRGAMTQAQRRRTPP